MGTSSERDINIRVYYRIRFIYVSRDVRPSPRRANDQVEVSKQESRHALNQAFPGERKSNSGVMAGIHDARVPSR